MNNFKVTEKIGTDGVKIVVVGVGGGGIGILNAISDTNKNIKTIAIDAGQPDSLHEAVADYKIELAYEPTRGLGYYKPPAFVKYLRGKTKKEIDEMRKQHHK